MWIGLTKPSQKYLYPDLLGIVFYLLVPLVYSLEQQSQTPILDLQRTVCTLSLEKVSSNQGHLGDNKILYLSQGNKQSLTQVAWFLPIKCFVQRHGQNNKLRKESVRMRIFKETTVCVSYSLLCLKSSKFPIKRFKIHCVK